MCDLYFEIAGAEAARHGLAPMMNFTIRVYNGSEDEAIYGGILNARIHIQPRQRPYTPREKERLSELFGAPEEWGQSLRNTFWSPAQAALPPFSGTTEFVLSVPCSFDLNLAATKYFYALDGHEAALLFFFSGSVFYASSQIPLQSQRISWEKEAVYRLPVASWQAMMEFHYPNSAWLYLDRAVFDRLYEFKRRNEIATWDEAVMRLLPSVEREMVTV